MIYINAENHVIGRLSTFISKKLLEGEEVVVLNSDKAVVQGSKYSILSEYRTIRDMRHKRRGPYYPRMPDRIFKRTVRGMLPYQKPRGRAAFKNLRVYIGVPEEFSDKEMIVVDNAINKNDRFITLKDISLYLGGKTREERL